MNAGKRGLTETPWNHVRGGRWSKQQRFAPYAGQGADGRITASDGGEMKLTRRYAKFKFILPTKCFRPQYVVRILSPCSETRGENIGPLKTQFQVCTASVPLHTFICILHRSCTAFMYNLTHKCTASILLSSFLYCFCTAFSPHLFKRFRRI